MALHEMTPVPIPKVDARCFVYTIDANDVIISINDAWRDFATENGDEALGDRVIGRPIWDFIHPPETRQLHQTVLERVRETGIPVQLPFRCDSPTERRFMQMLITQGPLNEVTYQNRIICTEARETPVRLDISPTAIKGGKVSGPIQRLCSWCKRADVGKDEWVEIEDAIRRLNLFGQDESPILTHTACPTCHQQVVAQLSRLP